VHLLATKFTSITKMHGATLIKEKNISGVSTLTTGIFACSVMTKVT
jgi:hypothetical protein